MSAQKLDHCIFQITIWPSATDRFVVSVWGKDPEKSWNENRMFDDYEPAAAFADELHHRITLIRRLMGLPPVDFQDDVRFRLLTGC